MKILTNQRARKLFLQISLCIFGFLLFSLLLSGWTINKKTLWVQETSSENTSLTISMPICVFGMGIVVLALCYRYFKEQDRIMEGAVAKIRALLSGDRDARIECDEEGELYRLFHEVNSLAAILMRRRKTKENQKNFYRTPYRIFPIS